MSLLEWISSIGLVAIIGLVFKTNRDNDAKVTRLYQRLDESKQNQEDKYTRKEICAVLHTQLNHDISEIKGDIKILLKHNGY